MDKTKSFYFRGFDSLRFLAASMVVFCHIELVRHYRGMNTPVSLHWIYETGKLAVSAFFVMSGFLITYLLLDEKKQAGTINIKHFYIRRALRIWPLYYLLVAIIFFVLPATGIGYLPGQSEELERYFGLKLLFFLLLMPQMLFLKFKPVPGAEQFWTIGAEEIFYFIWPLLLKKTRQLPKIIIGLLAAYCIIKYACWQWAFMPFWKHRMDIPFKVYLLLYYNRVDCILIGALCGYFFYQKSSRFISIVSSRLSMAGALIILVGLFAVSSKFGPFDYIWYSLLFSVVISTLAIDSAVAAPAIFEFMGKLSYGLYLWHFVAVFAAFYLLGHIDTVPASGTVYTVLLYLLSYGLTFLLAFLSYYLYERWFLRFKSRFAK